MKAKLGKTHTKQSNAVAGASSARQVREKSDVQFEDRRPAVVAQRELAGKADNSLQAVRIAQLQAIADGSAAEAIQRQGLEEEEVLMQGKFQPLQIQNNNTGLPDNLKSGMEQLSGRSLDHVKVHYNSSKPAAVQAHAYAQGTDIHLGPGQEKHLPHELGHVVQQAQGRVQPTMSVNGISVNDNAGLESEATSMGDKALRS